MARGGLGGARGRGGGEHEPFRRGYVPPKKEKPKEEEPKPQPPQIPQIPEVPEQLIEEAPARRVKKKAGLGSILERGITGRAGVFIP